jgi:hypothetical protein
LAFLYQILMLAIVFSRSSSYPDRTVHIEIAASAKCTAFVKKEHYNFFAILTGSSKEEPEPPRPAEFAEEEVQWAGGILGTADIVNREFVKIIPESIISSEELSYRKK